jgi:hypothetical protein
MDDPLGMVRVTVDRKLKKVRALVETPEMARAGPPFQVAGIEDGQAVFFKEDHNPVLSWGVPEDVRVTGVLAADLLVGIKNGISFEAGEGGAVVRAVSKGLNLLFF